jgi:hypothetical protein
MKILYNEFRSLLSKRAFYIVVTIVFLISILIVYLSSKSIVTPDGVEFSSADYKEVQNIVEHTDNPQNYLNSQLQSLSDNHIFGKTSLYKLFLSRLEEINNYKKYIDSINNNADITGNSVLVEGTDSFIYRNIQKTKNDYNKLKRVIPIYTERNGVNLATTNIAVDLLFLFLMFVIVMLLITVEKPMLPLYKSTIGGRRKLIASKISLSIIICFVLHTAMTAMLYTISFSLFPIKDFSVPIQSVFINSSLKISILQYLILAYIMRFFVYNLFISIFVYLSVKTSQAFDALGIFGVIMGISALLFVSISTYSFLNILKYINFFYILQPSQLLYTYINLNFFGFPITYLYIISAVILITFFILMGISIYIFEYAKVISKPVFKFSINIIHLTTVNLFLHELWRLIVANKVLIIMIFGLVMQLSHINSYHLYITKEETYYYQELETAKQQIDPMAWASKRHNILSDSGSVEQVSAINRLMVLLNYIENKSEQYGKLSIVYDTPYKTLLLDTSDRNAVNTLIIIVLILLSIIPIREQALSKLFHTTKNGRKKLFFIKSFMLLIVSVAIFITVYLPEFITICSTYNATDFNASMKSLIFLQNTINVPIYVYLIFVYAIRLIAIISISFLAMLFSKKGIYVALIIFSVLFLLPALFNVFDIEIFKYYPSNWILSVNHSIQSS